MVSSRCVAGLSIGRRPVSASVTMKSAPKANRWPGLTAAPGSAMVRAAILPRLVDPALRASAQIASATGGSAEGGRSGAQGEREDSQRDGGLGEGGDCHLAAGSHPAERRARVEPGEREEERGEQEEGDDEQQVSERGVTQAHL